MMQNNSCMTKVKLHIAMKTIYVVDFLLGSWNIIHFNKPQPYML